MITAQDRSSKIISGSFSSDDALWRNGLKKTGKRDGNSFHHHVKYLLMQLIKSKDSKVFAK